MAEDYGDGGRRTKLMEMRDNSQAQVGRAKAEVSQQATNTSEMLAHAQVLQDAIAQNPQLAKALLQMKSYADFDSMVSKNSFVDTVKGHKAIDRQDAANMELTSLADLEKVKQALYGK